MHGITMWLSGVGVFILMLGFEVNMALAGLIALITQISTAVIWCRIEHGKWNPL